MQVQEYVGVVAAALRVSPKMGIAVIDCILEYWGGVNLPKNLSLAGVIPAEGKKI
jgi:hypothetical protein